MKKKNNSNNTAGKKVQPSANNYFSRVNKTLAQLFNTGKYYLSGGRALLSEGNIFGESEEDFYSRTLSA